MKLLKDRYKLLRGYEPLPLTAKATETEDTRKQGSEEATWLTTYKRAWGSIVQHTEGYRYLHSPPKTERWATHGAHKEGGHSEKLVVDGRDQLNIKAYGGMEWVQFLKFSVSKSIRNLTNRTTISVLSSRLHYLGNGITAAAWMKYLDKCTVTHHVS
jgi:hypothetical protein